MEKKKRTSHEKVVFMAQFAVLLALEIIVNVTPLGSIPIGPIVATLGMVPVIICAVLLGMKAGALMGFFFGLLAFITATFMPASPTDMFFTPFYSIGELSGNGWSLVVAFVPRILIGVVAAAVYSALSKKTESSNKIAKSLPYFAAGVAGSLTNTILVLGGIYIFFGAPYASLFDTSFELLLGALGLTVLTNGIPEAIISALLTFGVCKPVQSMIKRS